MSGEDTNEIDLNVILDPTKTSVAQLDDFLSSLRDKLDFVKMINIIEGFECTDEYRLNHGDHYQVILTHALFAYLEMKTEDSIEKAKKLLRDSIQRFPETTTYQQYVCYAQLISGIESLNMYEKASEIILEKMQIAQNAMKIKEDPDKSDEHKPIGEELSMKLDLRQVYTAIGELYVTDLIEQENSLGLAMEYFNKSQELGLNLPSIDHLLLKFAVYTLQKQQDEALYPNAGQEMKKTIKEIALALLSQKSGDWDVETVKKCVEASISTNSYFECFTILSEFEKVTGLNNEVMLSMWARYHHASATYHLKGFRHYSTRLAEVIAGLENSREATEETTEIKKWLLKIVRKTHSSIEIVENGGDEFIDDDFEEMETYSVESKSESMIEEVTISDSDDDDDGCVIIENGNSDLDESSDISIIKEVKSPASAVKKAPVDESPDVTVYEISTEEELENSHCDPEPDGEEKNVGVGDGS